MQLSNWIAELHSFAHDVGNGTLKLQNETRLRKLLGSVQIACDDKFFYRYAPMRLWYRILEKLEREQYLTEE